MVRRMIIKVADYIVSPLAMGTHANYECIKAGKTKLQCYDRKWDLPEPFIASIMDEAILANACHETGIGNAYTKFERMAILAAARALQATNINADKEDVLFIISTTKGNIELADEHLQGVYSSKRLLLTETAKQISQWFHNPNEPLVVCNACISGLSAQMEAYRALESGRYKYAVVIGVDVLSPFIVSGFQSLKALSDNLCRPFDENRTGLNLGEAAACIIYKHTNQTNDASTAWHIIASANRNDAYHTSSPSKIAEGAYFALRSILRKLPVCDIAFINVHGTATLFNDEMEAVALHRAGLEQVPVNGLKGYFGHTLGASGVLETLISMEALEDYTILATKGFTDSGVSRKINISSCHRKASGNVFLKMMAGFGGCNAIMAFQKGISMEYPQELDHSSHEKITHTVHLTESEVTVDGQHLNTQEYGMNLLKSLYHTYGGNYPKFYKMDPLCKLGFIASELLLKAEAKSENISRFVDREDRAIVFIGRSASICADKIYQATIQNKNEYFPSPSAFIYTLPNILNGEIAIRNHYHGETLYLLQEYPIRVKQLMEQVLDSEMTSVIGGWIEMENTEKFEAILYIIKK